MARARGGGDSAGLRIAFEVLELDEEILRRLVAVFRIFLQTPADDALELGRRFVVETRDRLG